MRRIKEKLHHHKAPTTGTQGVSYAGDVTHPIAPLATAAPTTVAPIVTPTVAQTAPTIVEETTVTTIQEELPLERGMNNLSLGTSLPSEIIATERHELPAVVKETILPSERIEVQPVVHRDIEQTEVHEVLQPMKEREIAPTNVIHTTLPAEVIPEIHRGTMPVIAPAILPETFVAPVTREQIERAPIVEETVHKKIIEEIQPILYKEVIRPVVIEQVQPIYERIVEAPVVLNEERAVQDLGVRNLGGMTQPTTFSQGYIPSEHVTVERTTTITQEPLGTGLGTGLGSTPLSSTAPLGTGMGTGLGTMPLATPLSSTTLPGATTFATVPVIERTITTVDEDATAHGHHGGLGDKLKHALHRGTPGKTDSSTPLGSTRTI